jgi:hypothetical protein
LRGAFVGWFGPVFWPYAYEDIFDYALWPADYDYGPSFWTYAYDDVLGGMFEPYGYAEAVAGEPAARRAGGSGRGAATELCDAQAPELTGWPIARIIATVEPNDAQRAALDELKAAAAEAARLLAGPCPRTLPATPIARLEAIEKRLEAMRHAIDIVAPALAKFYDSLGDEQKARFNAIGRQSNAGDDAGRSCPQQPQGLPEQSIRRIAEIVRPTLAQRAALDDLKDASVRAVEALRAACPIEPPLTPPGRIAALRKRLDAMIEATRIERTALVRFYGELSDEQKARMNAMNRPHG